MSDNVQKQLRERIVEIVMFVATLAGLVFMVLYWR